MMNFITIFKRFSWTFLFCLLSFGLLTIEHVYGRLPLSFLPFYKPNVMILWCYGYAAFSFITIKLCRENGVAQRLSWGLLIAGLLNTACSFYIAPDVDVFLRMTLSLSAHVMLYVLPFLKKTEESVGDFLCHVIFCGVISFCCLGFIALSYGLIYFVLLHLFNISIAIPQWLWFHIGNFSGCIVWPILYLPIIHHEPFKLARTKSFISYIFVPVLLVLGSLIWIYGFKMAWHMIMPPEGKTLLFIWSVYALALCVYILSYNRYGRDKDCSQAFALFLSVPLLLAMISLGHKICIDGLTTKRLFQAILLVWFMISTIGIFWKQSIKIILGSLAVILFAISIEPISLHSVTARIQARELKVLSAKKYVTKKEMNRAKEIVMELVMNKQTHKLWFKLPRTEMTDIMKVLDLAEKV